MERQSVERNLNSSQPALDATAINLEPTAEHDNKSGVYISHGDLIKEKMLTIGVPAHLYAAAYASIKGLAQSRYGDGNYSEDWINWTIESRMWDYYFSPQPFPAQEPDRGGDASSMASNVPREETLKEETSRGQSVVDNSAPALPKNIRGTINGDTASSTTQSSPRRQYRSQSGYMSSKATSLGYRQPQFDDALSDKYREARDNFPSESADWQDWWAESTVWAKYFKRSFFPEREPPRLSRSLETNIIVQRSPRGSNRYRNHHLESDWYRPSRDQVNSYHRHSTNERTDSYYSKTRSPSVVGAPTYPNNLRQGGDLPSRNVTADNNSRRSGSQYRDSTDSMKMDHPNTSLQNLQFAEKLTASQRSDTSQTITSHTINAVRDKQYFGPPGYRPLEKEMTKKADRLGIRHRFFQVLQSGRDLANDKHGACSKQYKNWFADSLTWKKLFKGRFPGEEPMGLNMHSDSCPLYKRAAAVASNPHGFEKSIETLIGNTESCWKEHAQHHNSTEVDRLLMEEQVKREGALRMVLDECTGEVVNLKVFAMRTRFRALDPQRSNTAPKGKENQDQRDGDAGYSSSSQKRKATGMEGGDGAGKKLRF